MPNVGASPLSSSFSKHNLSHSPRLPYLLLMDIIRHCIREGHKISGSLPHVAAVGSVSAGQTLYETEERLQECTELGKGAATGKSSVTPHRSSQKGTFTNWW